MVDSVGGAQSAQNLQKSQRAQTGKSERSFAEFQKERTGKSRKKEGKKTEKKGADAAAAKAAAGSEYAQRLAEQLGISEGEAEALPGEVGEAGAGKGPDGGGGGGGGVGGDGEGEGTSIAESGVEEAMLGMVEGESGKGGESFKTTLGDRNAGDADFTGQTAKEEMVAVDSDRAEFKAEVEDTQDVDQDVDLESELNDQLFASGIGNPLMAQRATEPQAVSAVRQVQQLPPAIVDKVVENVRFGETADGGHEFQIDLKQDVFGGAELKILTKDGKVTIQMVSDDTNLHHAAKNLATQLKAKGINVGGVEVMTSSEAATRMADERAAIAGGTTRARSKSAWADEDELR